MQCWMRRRSITDDVLEVHFGWRLLDRARLTAKVPGRYPDPGLAAPAVMVK